MSPNYYASYLGKTCTITYYDFPQNVKALELTVVGVAINAYFLASQSFFDRFMASSYDLGHVPFLDKAAYLGMKYYQNQHFWTYNDFGPLDKTQEAYKNRNSSVYVLLGISALFLLFFVMLQSALFRERWEIEYKEGIPEKSVFELMKRRFFFEASVEIGAAILAFLAMLLRLMGFSALAVAQEGAVANLLVLNAGGLVAIGAALVLVVLLSFVLDYRQVRVLKPPGPNPDPPKTLNSP